MRRILSTAFNIILKLLGIRYSDTQAGLKAFRKSVFKKVSRIGLVKRYAFDAEPLALANLLRLRGVEEKVRMSSRFSLKHIMYMLIDLMGVFYRLKIIKWYQKKMNNKYARYKPVISI